MKLAVLLMAGSLYAGQSLTNAISAPIPQLSTTSPHRLEWAMHDWVKTGTGYPARVNAAGINCYLTSGNFTCDPNQVNSVGSMAINLSAQPTTTVYGRYQFCPGGLPGGAATPTISLELWDVNGARIGVQTRTYSTVTTASWTSGIFFNNTGLAAGAVAFARIHTVCLPLNSRTPTTVSDADRSHEWKFDNNGNASAGGVNAGSGGTYVPTPYQFAYSVPKVRPTSYASSTALRAGNTEFLTGSDSYSQADASDAVTCEWNTVATPGVALPYVPNPTSCNPTTITPEFGPYTFRLTVRDVTGQTASAIVAAGAVAMTSAGVVVPPNANTATLLGPMIAMGRNPWGYADDTHLRAVDVRLPLYTSSSPPEWSTLRAGTVDYNVPNNVVRGRLSSAMTATDTIIPLNAGHTIDISTFPTIVYVGGTPGYGGEMMEVCGLDGGNVNRLVVCFGGRAYNGSPAANTRASNSAVYQNKAIGTGTSFVSTMCPVGAGLSGTSIYNTGSVTINSGALMTMNGNLTAWTTLNGVVSGLFIRVQGTHSGGTPFIWYSNIASVDSPTQITTTKSWPTGADFGTFNYTIMNVGTRNFAPQWVRPDSTVGQTVYTGPGYCASDTAFYFSGGLENTVADASCPSANTQCTRGWSYMQQFWITSAGNGTINFYDEVVANYRGWFRSGLEKFRTAARLIGDYWMKQPLLDEGWGAPFPRNASILGPTTGAVADGRTDNWYGIRQLAAKGVTAIADDCNADTREHAYEFMWLAFAANFDPDLVQRATWRSHVAAMYARDNGCKAAGNSFANGYQWVAATRRGPYTINTGDRIINGSGFSATICNETGNGTASITAGAGSMTVLTGSVLAGQAKILLSGRKAGQPFEIYAQYSGSGTGSIPLSLDWPGDTGTIYWQTENSAPGSSTGANWNMWKIGSGIAENDQPVLYGCRYISPTQLTLTRDWAGPNTMDLYFVSGNVPGWLQQPFIAGIKVLQMRLAALAVANTDPTLSANYNALAAALATWIRTNGYDPTNKGLYYFRVLNTCEPPLTVGDLSNSSGQIIPSCSYMPTNYDGARGLNAEVQTALRIWYESAPTAPNLATGDEFYAASWGCQLVTGGVPADTSWCNTYATNSELNEGKWYGFQFGVGAADQWPAARVGGLPAESLVSRTIRYAVGSAPTGTTSTIARVIWPNGTTADWSCSAGACTGNIDPRQGFTVTVQIRHSGVAGLLVAGQFLPMNLN